jgi:hypothetical protein
MSNLEDRSEAREAEHVNMFGDTIDRCSDKEYFQGGPAYPNLGPTVAKFRQQSCDADEPFRRRAYGRAVHAAIRALQRRELQSACATVSLPRDVGAMTDAQFMTMLRNQAKHPPRDADRPRYRYDDGSAERDYYRAMLESRGVDANKIVDLMPGNYSHRRTLWLKAAWNVIKTKRGTPYLAEAGYVCGDGKRFATEAKAIEYANRVHLNAGIVIAVEREPTPQPEAIGPAPQPLPGPSFEASATAMAMGLAMRQPKKRGRPFGSKNKPKLVAEPVKPAEQPKPVKPRVPSHYLSSASRVAYHAAM